MRNIWLVLLFFLVSNRAYSQWVALDGDDYLVHRVWMYDDTVRACETKVAKELYDYYQKERDHYFYRFNMDGKQIGDNRKSFVFSEHGRPVVKELARSLETIAKSETEKVEVALTYTQSLPYSYDSTSKGRDEYVRYPVETLVDGCGDCEDKSVLLAAILYEMNIGFVLLMSPDHIAVGVNCEPRNDANGFVFKGKKYYYVETTQTDFQIGQIPDYVSLAQIEVVPCDATPVLIVKDVQFESQPAMVFEKAQCVLEMVLQNLGPSKITGLQVYVALVTKNRRGERILAEEQLKIADLPESEERTEQIAFKSLIKENSVLRVEISGDNMAAQSFEYEMNFSRTNIENRSGYFKNR